MTYATLGFYLKALGSTSTPGDTVLFGLDQILKKIGSPTTDGTALNALARLIAGIGKPTDFPGGFEYSDPIAKARKMIGGGQSGGARSNDRNPFVSCCYRF